MKRYEIAPGAYVTQVPAEKFKRSFIQVHLVLESQRETASALAVLPHLLERRCEAFPDPLALSRRLYSLYGAELTAESYTAGACRVLTMAISGLQNDYALEHEDLAAEYLELLCNLLFAPKLAGEAFEAEDTDIEREKQMDYLRTEMNDKRSYCLRQARRKLYGDSVLGIEPAGYLEDMPQVGPERLYKVWKDLLSRAQIEVVMCGADAKTAGDTFREWLSKVERAPQEMPQRTVVPEGSAFAAYDEPMDTAQGKLVILCTGGGVPSEKEEAVMRVANALLGGLPTSRLFINVREKQSLCYYCTSNYAALKGTLTLDSGIDHPNAERAAKAMLHELETLQREPVSDEELSTACRAILNAFSVAKDSPDSLAGWAFNERLRGSDLSLDEAAELIKSVTKEDVQQALSAFTPVLQYVITKKGSA